MFWHFGDIHYSVLWKQLAPWALTLWEWNHACDSSCLRVLLKFKTLNPGGGSSLSSWLCAHCANPINLAPGSKQRAPGACLPRHPLKNPPPLSSQNHCHKGREAAPFPSSAAFLPPHLCGRRGGAFSPAGGGPDGEGGGRWGEKLFLGKASFSWLEARTGGKLQVHWISITIRKKILPTIKCLSGQKKWPIQMLKTPEFSIRQIKTLLDTWPSFFYR